MLTTTVHTKAFYSTGESEARPRSHVSGTDATAWSGPRRGREPEQLVTALRRRGERVDASFTSLGAAAEKPLQPVLLSAPLEAHSPLTRLTYYAM